MNRFIVILFLLVYACPAKSQYDLESKEKERMAKAKVKTQTQWTHDYTNGKPAEKGYKSSVTKYDTKGNPIEVSNYNEEGKIISLTVYQYDSKENKVNFERYQGNREKLQYSQKIVYDAKGYKTKEYGFDGVAMYSNTYQYDASGKLSEISYTVGNALVEKRKLSYSGERVEIKVYNATNSLTVTQKNTYNDKNQLTEEIKTGSSSNIIHTMDFLYSTSGTLLEETKMRFGEKLDYKKTYTYDSASRLIKEETTNLDGAKFVSHEYEYNNAGDLVVEKWIKNNRSKDLSTKKITYNSNGIYTEMLCYFATYKLFSLYKYTYEFY